MKEYVMTPDDQDAALGLTFESTDDITATKEAKEALPGLLAMCDVWNLYMVCRDDPERHVAKDDKGGFYEVLVTQLIMDDAGTNEIDC